MLLPHSIPNLEGPNFQMVWAFVELILYLCPHFLMAWLIRTMLKSLKINLCLESCNLNLNENQHWRNRISYKRTFSLIKATLSAIGK